MKITTKEDGSVYIDGKLVTHGEFRSLLKRLLVSVAIGEEQIVLKADNYLVLRLSATCSDVLKKWYNEIAAKEQEMEFHFVKHQNLYYETAETK